MDFAEAEVAPRLGGCVGHEAFQDGLGFVESVDAQIQLGEAVLSGQVIRRASQSRSQVGDRLFRVTALRGDQTQIVGQAGVVDRTVGVVDRKVFGDQVAPAGEIDVLVGVVDMAQLGPCFGAPRLCLYCGCGLVDQPP